MPDLYRIKETVSKMIDADAPEEEIEKYIASEGTTVEAVRDYGAPLEKTNIPVAQMEGQPGWKKGAATLWDSMNLLGQGYTHGFGDKIAGTIRAPFTDKTIAEEIAAMRKQTQASRDRQGAVGTGLEVAGAVIGPGMKGNALKQGGLFGLIDAYGNSDSWIPTTTEEVKDLAKGTAYGVGAGAFGQGVANIVGDTSKAVGSRISSIWASLPDRAKQRVYDLAEKVGWDKVDELFAQHGPETIAADVLEGEGHSLARTAANYSPDADTTLKKVVEGRSKGATQRVADSFMDAAEIPADATVESLKEAVFAKQRPAINQAYETAKAAGADLPYGPFEGVLKSPSGAEAYERSGRSIKNIVAANGDEANSELARLDLTYRKLRDIGTEAYTQGRGSDGKEAMDLANTLKKQIDASIAGPEWSAARNLRRTAGEIDDSFLLGEQLAQPSVALDLPGQVATAASPKAVKQAFAAETRDRLLNARNPRPGSLSMLDSPMATQARTAALGESAPIVDKARATEDFFNKTKEAITGNSTTTKQMIAAGALGAAGSASVDPGFDITSPSTWARALPAGFGVAGALRAGPAAYRKLAGGRFAKEAPFLAQELVKNYISRNRPIPQNILEKIGPKQREAIMKAIMMGLNQANTAQTRQQER